MTTTELDLTADYINVREIISRVEELREERQALADTAADERNEAAELPDGGGKTDAEEKAAASETALDDWDASEKGEELAKLESILENLAGNGGDEKWEGAWYPLSLIRDNAFVVCNG